VTRTELAAQIKKDIERKGHARVPIGILQEALSVDTHASTANDAAMEEFAGNHGWRIRHGNDLPTPRAMFYPVEKGESSQKEK
jgi:hypothetical protein